MLISLHVKNLALIQETEVYFGPSLNILTGETGAGKSIIIGSVNLALGAKADTDLIRQGAEYGLVELLFKVEQEEAVEQLRSMDIPLEEDGTVLIQRKIMAGRSVSKVNGETVVAKQLKQLASYLIDIHGQHEHQSLLNTSKQKQILDSYAGEELSAILSRVRQLYTEYQEVLEEIRKTDVDGATRKRELDLASFELQEILDANLQPGEDEELENAYRRMVNSQKISGGVGAAYTICSEGREAVSDLLSRAIRELRPVSELDDEIADLEQQLLEIESLVRDFGRQAYDYMNSLEFDPGTFAEVESRLNLVNHLKDKYGSTIETVIAYGDSLQEQIDRLQNAEEYLAALQERIDIIQRELLAACETASAIRKKTAGTLAAEMKAALLHLNFLDVQFEICVEGDPEKVSADGYDRVNYLISTNPGEPIKPLNQVASGGELSRIMLALKTVLADRDGIDTLIFDEIDSGISGKTAWKVAEKLGRLGRAHQILCITHLPQIAAMADTHFLIEKKVEEGHAVTHIREVHGEDSVKELARLLGGEEISSSALENAREMKKTAMEIK